MQVALDAEKLATANATMLDRIGTELDNVTALVAAGSGDGGDVMDTIRELVKDISATRDALTNMSSHVAELHKGNAELAQWRESLGGHLPSEQADQILTQLEQRVGEPLRQVREQYAQHDELLTEADKRWRELATRLNQMSGAAQVLPSAELTTQSAPHVLGLIAQLQRRVYEIGKGREFKAENSRGQTTQQYDFRGVEDAQNAVGSAQREIGLIGPAVTVLEKNVTVTEVPKSGYTQVWTTVSVTCRYTFQSTVDGSEWSTEGCGMGRDLGDKAESKALAGAYKYALFHGLNIPVKGVFVDAEIEDPRIEREQQDIGRTYGNGRPPAQWSSDELAAAGMYRTDGRDRPRDADQLDLSPVDPPGDVESAAAAVRRDERSPEEQAHAALAAGRKARNLAEVNKVVGHAQQLGIMDIHIDGGDNTSMPLRMHLMALAKIAPRGEPVSR